jgi:hypothetical protein
MDNSSESLDYPMSSQSKILEEDIRVQDDLELVY